MAGPGASILLFRVEPKIGGKNQEVTKRRARSLVEITGGPARFGQSKVVGQFQEVREIDVTIEIGIARLRAEHGVDDGKWNVIDRSHVNRHGSFTRIPVHVRKSIRKTSRRPHPVTSRH